MCKMCLLSMRISHSEGHLEPSAYWNLNRWWFIELSNGRPQLFVNALIVYPSGARRFDIDIHPALMTANLVNWSTASWKTAPAWLSKNWERVAEIWNRCKTEMPKWTRIILVRITDLSKILRAIGENKGGEQSVEVWFSFLIFETFVLERFFRDTIWCR